MGKIIIFLEIVKLVKNWTVVFLVYFGLYKKEFFTLHLKNGISFKLRTKSTDLQAFANVWILKEYQKKGFEIQKNDSIIDIGGHIGLFALYASKKCPDGKIISIEPHPDNFSLLKYNITKNYFQKTVLLNKAVTKNTESMKLFVDPLDDSAHSILKKGKNSIDIEGISLRDIMQQNEIKICNMLKMDCEGAEFEIIKSLLDEDLAKIQKICLEYHLKNNNMIELKNMQSRLIKNGFQVIMAPTNNELGMLYAKKE